MKRIILCTVLISSLFTACKKDVIVMPPLVLLPQPESEYRLDMDSVKIFRKQLALHWAPIHHQDVDPTGGIWTDHSLGGKSDYITAMDFDGDWIATNNWENTPNFDLNAVGYYSFIESKTHYFITYAFFHPRDWTDVNIGDIDEHENDLEAILTIIQKVDTLPYGQLLGGITVYHKHFYAYKTAESTLIQGQNAGLESTRLTLQDFNGSKHPVTAQQAKGHGLKAHPDVKIESGDGVIYYPYENLSEEPSSITDNHVPYMLIDMFAPGEIWSQRDNPSFFGSDGKMKGDNGDGGASPPWIWDDADDGEQNIKGEIATDPIKLVKSYFSNLGVYSETYVCNPYQGIEIE